MTTMFELGIAVCLLTSVSYFLYGMTGFGDAIIFHIGWYIICVALDYPGTIAEAVTYTVFYSTILSPFQAWVTRKRRNYKLAFWLFVSLVPGQLLGIYLLLFNIASPWFKRALGLLFFLVFLFRCWQEVKQMLAQGEASTAVVSPSIVVATVSPASVSLPSRSHIPLPTSDDESQDEAVADSPLGSATARRSSASNSANNIATTGSANGPLEPAVAPPFDTSTWRMRGIIVFTGVCAGFLGGLFGTDGPPLMVFVSHYHDKLGKDEWLGVRTLLQLVILPVRATILYYNMWDDPITDSSRWPVFAGLILGSSTALAASRVLGRRLNREMFNRIILLLLLSGSCLLLTAALPFEVTVCALVGGVVCCAVGFWLLQRRLRAKRGRQVHPED